MKITWRTPSQTLLDDVELERINSTAALLKLNTAVAIDSYTMSSDGPILTSIFLVSEGYLIEVNLNSKYPSFDICSMKSLLNYRVTFGVHDNNTVNSNESEISAESSLLEMNTKNDSNSNVTMEPTLVRPTPKSNEIKFVKISLKHTVNMESNLNYFGDDLENWLSYVLETYPKNLLLAQ